MGDVIVASGAANRLTEFSDLLTMGHVLVVTGRNSFKESGAMRYIEQSLRECDWSHFSIQAPLPGPESTAGWRESCPETPSVVVAVGGGAVIDSAKLIALATANGPIKLLTEKSDYDPAVPLIAIPTTSGSGSERTPFAVTFARGRKHSVEHASLLPAVALVDPRLADSMPPALTASTGLDALCHGFESLWAVASTDLSRELSLQALEGVWSSLERAVNSPTSSHRLVMAKAASLAGAAIAIARTTASHALSYYLTSEIGVPHGAAAAMTLGPLLELNYGVGETNCRDQRGPSHVKEVMEEAFEIIGASSASDARGALEAKIGNLPVPHRLADVGIVKDSQVAHIVRSVDLQRLQNNPRNLESSDLCDLLAQVA